MMKTGIIFDMDGTLWDSAENVAKCWDEVAKAQFPGRRDITTEDIKAVMGKTMDMIALELFPELTKQEREDIMDACCAKENEYLSRYGGILYPELESTLKKLSQKYHLYIVSNCQSGYIEAFFECHGLSQYFEDFECFGNNGLKKGDNIALVVKRNNLDRAIYVGDVQGDYDASVEAGVEFIHAGYGFGSIDAKVERIEAFNQLVPLLL